MQLNRKFNSYLEESHNGFVVKIAATHCCWNCPEIPYIILGCVSKIDGFLPW